MLMLNPQTVKFGAASWTDVTAVLVDRTSERLALEWTDLGPHVVFADAPEQRVTVRVVRRLVRETAFAPRPGDSGELVVYAGPTAGESLRRRVRMSTVITAVAHEVTQHRGAVQTVTLVAISSDGSADPIIVEDASDGTF